MARRGRSLNVKEVLCRVGLAALAVLASLCGLAPSAVATTATFAPVADSFVWSSYPDSTFGAEPALKVDDSPGVHSYLRFDVGVPAGATITGATLLLFATTESTTRGFYVTAVTGGWEEGSLSYDDAPPLGPELGSSGSWDDPGYQEVSLPASAVRPGLNSFGAGTTSSYSKAFHSREGTNPPELVVTYQDSTSGDTSPPNTAITSGPLGTITGATNTFAFRSSEPGSTFQCAMDEGSFSACSPPFTSSSLGDGAHTFRVRAIDAAGNVDPTPARWAFTVDTTRTLVFSDNFDGALLDAAAWHTCFWWATLTCSIESNNELELYNPEDVYLEGGALRMRARKRDLVAWNGATYNYTSGMAITGGRKYEKAPGFTFTYGYAEARVKVPKGKGLWPAFWMLPASYGSRPEIDAMEILGDSTNVQHMNVHFRRTDGSYVDQGQSWTGPDFSAGWHTFAVDWQPDAIVWYVDGVERWRFTDSSAIPSEPMYLLLNLAVGGNWPGAPDASTVFPSYFDVDHVRVWQRK